MVHPSCRYLKKRVMAVKWQKVNNTGRADEVLLLQDTIIHSKTKKYRATKGSNGHPRV